MKLRLLALLSLLLIILVTCRKEDPADEQPANEVKPLQIMGNVEIPDNVPNEKIGTLEVLSGFYSNPVTINPPHLSNKSGNDKYCVIETSPNTFQFHTITNNGQPFLYGFSINANVGDEIYFNSESTAISLLLLSPYLMVSDPNNAPATIEKIKIAPSFNQFKNHIQQLMANGSISNQSPYIDVSTIPNYKGLIVEVLTSLNDNSNLLCI